MQADIKTMVVTTRVIIVRIFLVLLLEYHTQNDIDIANKYKFNIKLKYSLLVAIKILLIVCVIMRISQILLIIGKLLLGGFIVGG